MKNSIRLNLEQLIAAYVAFDSLPTNTQVFIDKDGDVAYLTGGEEWETPPAGYTFIGLACPGNLPSSNFTIFQDEDDAWHVSGYGNQFDSREGALEFAIPIIGLEMDDLESVKTYISEHLNTGVLVA